MHHQRRATIATALMLAQTTALAATPQAGVDDDNVVATYGGDGAARHQPSLADLTRDSQPVAVQRTEPRARIKEVVEHPGNRKQRRAKAAALRNGKPRKPQRR